MCSHKTSYSGWNKTKCFYLFSDVISRGFVYCGAEFETLHGGCITKRGLQFTQCGDLFWVVLVGWFWKEPLVSISMLWSSSRERWSCSWSRTEHTDRNVESFTNCSFQNQHYSKRDIHMVLLQTFLCKGPITQASITRTNTRTLKMHALDWLNKRWHILREPKECVLLASLSFLLQCDSAFKLLFWCWCLLPSIMPMMRCRLVPLCQPLVHH